jgi:hypothetical protein
MPLHPENLENNGYRLLSSLQHMDIIPFVQRQLRSGGPIARSYQLLTLGLLAASGAFLAYSIIASPGDWEKTLIRYSYGLALAFLLAPIHELIHGIALKAVGAPSVQYRANWRKFYLMAAADRFVVGEKAFYLVAFAPFAVISLAALALLAWHPLTALALLFLHTAFCAGDFALSEYMHANREKEILTYDLVDEQISYFYVKEE